MNQTRQVITWRLGRRMADHRSHWIECTATVWISGYSYYVTNLGQNDGWLVCAFSSPDMDGVPTCWRPE